MLLVVVPGRERRFVLISLLISLIALTPFAGFAARSVTLAWDPSPDPNVTGYTVYYGVASRTYTNTVSAGTATTATVPGLVEGKTYYFAATCVDTVGLESDYSTEVVYTVPTPNQPPTLNALANVTINESAGLQTVSLSGISTGASNETQTLTVTASSSNPSLIPTPTVNYSSPSATGSISFTPVPLAYGSASITITVNDGASSNNVVSRSFTVTVNPVNQAPTLNTLANVTINESAGPQTVSLSGISTGASNETQTLTVTATSSNPSLIPAPTVNYTSPSATGSISFTPTPLAYGSASITVSVNDGGTSNNVISRSFTVTINQLPTISAISNLVIAVDTQSPAVPFTVGDGETAVSELTLSGASSDQTLVKNTDIVFGGSGAERTVTITPKAGLEGSADITITVSDGNAIATSTFQLTVRAKPIAPANFRITQAGP